jgi:hypothetical protein
MIADTPQGAPAMNATGTITMTMREVDRLKVIETVVDMGLKPGRAAERLGLTVRQIERLVIRYLGSGAAGLARAWQPRAVCADVHAASVCRRRGRPADRTV